MRRFSCLVLFVLGPVASAADTPTAEQIQFFEAKIRPVLIESCYSCHSSDKEKIRGGLTLDTRQGVLAGGDSGVVVVPGKPDKSLLLQLLTTKDADRHMPPKGQLSAEVIADVRRWIEMGAPDPRTEPGKLVKHDIDIEAGRQFWAFQPPKPSPVPTVRDATWAKTDVDRFVLAGLEAKGLKPVGDVDKRTLLRRVYLDLTGLPPTPDAVDAFIKDGSPTALATVVDRLLASPHFGERWGKHWLDVARFAESTGKSVNYNYPHAWRYRDYVIAAYNADTPLPDFVRQQLAGDLLPAKTDAEKARNLIATGFLAIGTKTLNERNRVQFELDVVDEQIDVVSQAFLGLTAACARCHDHKFDPIPQTDYYALAGIFRSTETCYGTITSIQSRYPSPLLPLPAGADLPAGLPPLSPKERTAQQTQLKQLQDELAEMTKKDVRDSFLTMGGVRRRIQIAMLEAKLGMYDTDGTAKKQAMGVREKTRPKNSPVYQRGEPAKPGQEVPRGVLQVVTPDRPKITAGSGRKELADWIASPNNPLTARVYVNRVWLHLFGRGLVATPDNFGTTGTPPSNLALLDHLATTFTASGSSTKTLIKSLVLSRAYQLSTKSDAKNFEADPDNALVWRMTPGRLDAEVIRDAMLAVSGTLDRTPPVGSSVSRGGEGYAAAQQRGGFFAPVPDETHRSVYLPAVRDNLPEVLALFDAADPNLVVGDRSNTTVPTQALYMMNNRFVLKQSEAAAEQLAKLSSDRDRVREAYRRFFGRPPTNAELDSADSFLAKYATGKRTKKEAFAAFCQALFASAEFLLRN